MKNKNMIYALLLVGAFASCQKDNLGINTQEDTAGKVNFKLTATNGGPTFRTGYSEGEDKLAVTWLTGDKIGLFSVVDNEAKNANATFSIKEDADITNSGKSAVFSGELSQSADWDMNFYAYYPYNASAGTDPTKIPVSVAEQVIDGKESTHLATYDVMVADPLTAVQAGAEDTNLDFKHVMAIADFTISLPTGAETQEVKEIKILRADGTSIPTGGTLNITTADASDRLKVTAAETNQSVAQITTVQNVSLAAGESFQARVAVIPADWTDKTVSVVVTTDKGTYQFDKTGMLLEAGKRYTSTLALENKLAVNIGDYYYADGTWSTVQNTAKKTVGIVVYAGQEGGAINGFVASLQDVNNGLNGKIYQFKIPELPGASSANNILSGTQADWAGQSHAQIVAAKRTEDGYKDMNFILQSVDYAPEGVTNGPAAQGKWYTPAVNQLYSLNNHTENIEASLTAIGGASMIEKSYWTSTEYNTGNASSSLTTRNVFTVTLANISPVGATRADNKVNPLRPFLTF
ncbi:fimbrillin family protein [Sphingobacterium sp. LRF_L2]|uniref:fimbrillin family protein n=1 Tax=Sphingobacterium sp. LRF_L2 TaxID=3369421 RepID=UPI003F5F05C2